jgi:TetR/AcrR family transcriptional regulator, transcriptional repressor for nem operon
MPAMSRASETSKEAVGPPMRERIRDTAIDALILHGVRGMNFGMLAESLSTTRANIHYHYGSKEALIEAAVEHHVAAATARMRGIWATPGVTLQRRLSDTLAYHAERHARLHGATDAGRPWSLIARMRQDRDLLGPRARDALAAFSATLEQDVAAAVRAAVVAADLPRDMPVDDLARLIAAIVDSAGAITQDTGGFGRLDALYLGLGRLLAHGLRGAG